MRLNHIYFLSRKNSPKLSFSYSSQKSSSRKTELTNEWSIWGTVLLPTLVLGLHRTQRSTLQLWLSWTIFSKLSVNVMSYPLLKNYYRKSPMKYGVLRVILLLLKILSSVTSLLGISKCNLLMWYLPICPDASILLLQKEKILLCWEKAILPGSTSVNTRGVGGKGTARKGRCTAKAKLTAAAELKTSCKARCAFALLSESS